MTFQPKLMCLVSIQFNVIQILTDIDVDLYNFKVQTRHIHSIKIVKIYLL